MKYIDPDFPIYGVQARGLVRPEPCPTSIEQMAADYIDQIRIIQPIGPYYLLGWSLGGLIAHAMAAELQQRGEQVALLAMLDAQTPSDLLSQNKLLFNEQDIFIAMLGDHTESQKDQPLTFAQVLDTIRKQGNIVSNAEEHHISALIKIAINHNRLLRDFTPSRVHGDLLLFNAIIDPTEFVPTPDRWRPYIDGNIEVHDIASRHIDMTEPWSLAQIGPILAAKLQEITDHVSPSHRKR